MAAGQTGCKPPCAERLAHQSDECYDGWFSEEIACFVKLDSQTTSCADIYCKKDIPDVVIVLLLLDHLDGISKDKASL